MEESPKEKFRVVDKRGSGNDQPEPAQEKDPGKQQRSAEPDSRTAAADEPSAADSQHSLEEVNFVSFLLSLYSSALVAFGKVPDPATGETGVHLESGKQMIDILSLLMEKTRGNLSEEEDKLLDNILYELRMIYLEETRAIKL